MYSYYIAQYYLAMVVTSYCLGCAPPMYFIFLLSCTAFISYSEYLKKEKHLFMHVCPGYVVFVQKWLRLARYILTLSKV